MAVRSAYSEVVEAPPPGKLKEFWKKIKRGTAHMFNNKTDEEIREEVLVNGVNVHTLMDQGFSLERIISATGLTHIDQLYSHGLRTHWAGRHTYKTLVPKEWDTLRRKCRLTIRTLADPLGISKFSTAIESGMSVQNLLDLGLNVAAMIKRNWLSRDDLFAYASLPSDYWISAQSWIRLGLTYPILATTLKLEEGEYETLMHVSPRELAEALRVATPGVSFDNQSTKDLLETINLTWI